MRLSRLVVLGMSFGLPAVGFAAGGASAPGANPPGQAASKPTPPGQVRKCEQFARELVDDDAKTAKGARIPIVDRDRAAGVLGRAMRKQRAWPCE